MKDDSQIIENTVVMSSRTKAVSVRSLTYQLFFSLFTIQFMYT